MSEPTQARSALRLRATLSVIALVIGLVAGVVLLLAAPSDVRTPYVLSALICFAVVLIAAVDLLVIRRRLRERGGPS